MNEHRNHSLHWTGQPAGLEEVIQAIQEMDPGSERHVRRVLNGTREPWTHRRILMARMSRRWPETVFTLESQGRLGRNRTVEHYQNGLVQTETQTGVPPFRPEALRPPGPGTNGMGRIGRTPLRDRPLRCSGTDSNWPDLEDVHFQDDRDTPEPEPNGLWYAELEDDEFQVEGSGFLCLDCLHALGLEPQGRPTLEEETERRDRERKPRNPQCAWQDCPREAEMRVLYPSPEDVWLRQGDYCSGHSASWPSRGGSPGTGECSPWTTCPRANSRPAAPAEAGRTRTMTDTETHNLTTQGKTVSRRTLHRALAQASGRTAAHMGRVARGEPARWDERQQHMAQVSLMFPDTVFTLEVRGETEDTLRREHYQGGLVQTECPGQPSRGLDPEQLGRPQGSVGRNTLNHLESCPLPDPMFRCEGVEASLQEMEDTHLQDDTGGYFQPQDLRYAEMMDTENAVQTWGFFGNDCLEAVGAKPDGKPTLSDIARERLGPEAARNRGLA